MIWVEFMENGTGDVLKAKESITKKNLKAFYHKRGTNYYQ